MHRQPFRRLAHGDDVVAYNGDEVASDIGLKIGPGEVHLDRFGLAGAEDDTGKSP